MSRQIASWQLDGVDGPVVVVDVIRAFTTAAQGFRLSELADDGP